MTVSIGAQTAEFLLGCALGVLLGALYDVFRLIRLIFRTPIFVTAVLDTVFWVAAVAAFVVFILVPCEGQFRFYHILGVALGAALHFLTVSPVLVRLGLQFANLIQRLLHALLAPFRSLYRAVRRARARGKLRRQAQEGGEPADHAG